MNLSWQAIATFILRRRIFILIVLAGLTVFMYTVKGTKISQSISSSAIMSDGDVVKGYQLFRQYFGDDANVMVIALTHDLFELEVFQDLYDMTEQISQQSGVVSIISISKLYDVVRQDSPIESFQIIPLIPQRPQTQAEVDSIFKRIQQLPFYKGLILDESMETTLIAVSFDSERLDTKDKLPMVNGVKDLAYAFGDKYGVEPYFAGLPVLRVNMRQNQKQKEFFFDRLVHI
ncbi:MAG: hypothetical protein AAGM67_16585, partial [Bacteroidota bacterium]